MLQQHWVAEPDQCTHSPICQHDWKEGQVTNDCRHVAVYIFFLVLVGIHLYQILLDQHFESVHGAHRKGVYLFAQFSEPYAKDQGCLLQSR